MRARPPTPRRRLASHPPLRWPTLLLKEVWGPAYATQTQYLRVYMVQLRHKLERDSARPEYLVTEPGVGYRLNADPGS